jgi:hypothetical protein
MLEVYPDLPETADLASLQTREPTPKDKNSTPITT